MERKRSWPAVSHIWRRTTFDLLVEKGGKEEEPTLSLSGSTTRLVTKDAPTVLVVLAGENAFFTKRWTSEVLPTPWEPRTTIFASRDCAIVWRLLWGRCGVSSTRERGKIR
jgi:hypothetical protein